MGKDAKEFNYYYVLGTHAGASDEEIRDAYYRKAAMHHPDRGGTAEAFAPLAEAYRATRSATARARLARALGTLGTPCAACAGTGCLRRQRGLLKVELRPCSACCGAAYQA